MRFVPSTVTNKNSPGADAEAKVFDRLREAFAGNREGIGFYKFPVVDRAGERFDREPDFVILDKEYGLVIIEVKGYHIEHIEDIIGQTWILQGTSQSEAQPFSQARDQGFFIQSHFAREAALNSAGGHCKVPVNPIVALPNITRDEWEEAGHNTNPSARVLLQDDLLPAILRSKLDNLPNTKGLSDEVYQAARTILTGGEVISGKRGGVKPDPQTKGDYYQRVTRGLRKLDEEQEQIGLAIPPGPQQIRGIAGSGKTVILAMKAAIMHIKHPDWKIAITFSTQSLYPEVEELVDRFVTHFSDDVRGDNLEVLHGWGGKRQNGLYYKLALEAGVEPHTVETAKNVFDAQGPAALLGEVCADLTSSVELPQQFDAILIDEGQDFEPGFYRMCYHALTDDRRLIWAYDEAQNLTNLTAPTPSAIFGADEDILPDTLDLSGRYEGDIPKSRIMRRSYRAPRQALMLAHTLGMALKRPEAKIPRITRKTGWEDIGYEVEGDFREVDEEIKLTRPKEFSPHPLQNTTEAGPFVEFEVFAERETELEFVIDAIIADIENNGLDPEDILVIPLGDIKPSREIGQELSHRLDQQGVSSNILWQGNPDVFKRKGNVTISRIHRAKGNEAAQVYILNLEAVERDTWQSDPVQNRNELFVALTRSRSWCTITGTGATESVFDELEETIDETTAPEPTVSFPAPPHRPIDITGEKLPSATQSEITKYTAKSTKQNTSLTDENISKVYLGAGSSLDGWIPVSSEIVSSEVVPLVKENLVNENGQECIKVNFSKDVSISGWNEVDANVVRDKIEPIIQKHRQDT